MALPRKVLSSPSILSASAITGAAVAWYSYSSYRKSESVSTIKDSISTKTTFPASGFVSLALADSRMLSHDVKQLRFKLPEGDASTGLPTISSLLTQSKPAGAWFPVFRPYSPISAQGEPGYIEFIVKQYPGGKASINLHSLVPGQTLTVKQVPFLHEFDYQPNKYAHLTLIAGGAGITPFLQLLRTAFNDPEDKITKFSLVYANKTASDILLKDEFDDLQKKFPERFHVQYVLSKPSESGAREKNVEAGYITKDILRRALPSAKAQSQDVSQSKVLICGPPPMLAAVAGAKGAFGWTQGSVGGLLGELGVPKDGVFKF